MITFVGLLFAALNRIDRHSPSRAAARSAHRTSAARA
jgi:hypothetical protein